MPTLVLFLMMSVAGYAVFVFVSEGFNPVKAHRSPALQKRQVVAVLSGLLIALSPLILYVWPAVTMSNKVIHCLIAAAIGIIVLLIITGVATLIGRLFSGEHRETAHSKKDQRRTVQAQSINDEAKTTLTATSPALKTQVASTTTHTNQQDQTIAATKETAVEDSNPHRRIPTTPPTEESIEKHNIENGDKMTTTKLKKEPLENFNDPNQELSAALDEAEAEMRQATANENLVTTKGAELREAKPILEPADNNISLYSDQDTPGNIINEQPRNDRDTGTTVSTRTTTASTLPGNVEKLKMELQATDTSLQKADELMSELQRHSVELDGMRRSRIEEQDSTIVEQDYKIIEQQDQLTEESIASVAAQNLIGLQQDEINRVRSYGKKLEQLILQHQDQLSSHRKDLEKSREMAKKAAVLARQAADAHQKIKTIADQERQVRLQVEDKAHKAVRLAENAISALAKEEKKNAKHTTGS